MYLAHWGLREAPFRNAIDPRVFYESPTHEEALARLHFLIEGRRRAGLLLGAAGSGKSLLLEVLAGQARRTGRSVARISLLGLDTQELLWTLAASWGLDPEAHAEPRHLWRMIVDRLAEYHHENRASVVLLDDADQARDDVLPHILRLAQSDISSDPAATLVLAARIDKLGRLNERLLELADLRIDLLRWSAEDVDGYLEHALARAGRRPNDDPVFVPEAIPLLAELSAGVPRHVTQLADLALVAAAGHGLSAIDCHTLETVCAELGAVHQAAERG
jgi:type II secretory pathway predicted ATPase ExeA